MAYPENVLKRYRSYSYHHILIACDSTETAMALQTKATVTELQRNRQDQRGNKFKGQSLSGGSDKNYVVLIDGLVDSEFFINTATWSTIISPHESGQNAMAQVDGEIEIFEPYGAAFLERLVDTCDELGTDPVGLVFLLKTVFVGWNDDKHRSHPEMIENVKPFMFSLIDITSVMNETGSSYSMSIVGTQNGFGKLPHASNISKGFSIEINKGDTLYETLGKMEVELNDEYQAYLNEMKVDFGDSTDARYRPVRYVIKAEDYKESGFLAGTNELDRNSSDADKIVIQPGANDNIETVIRRIMESSKGVTDEANGDETKQKAIFKINSFLRSSPTEVVIEYQVNRYKMVTASYDDAGNESVTQGDNTDVRTYNYIFTGQNVDIIDFDIKMDMGLSFFHTAASTSPAYEQVTERTEPETSQNQGGGGPGQQLTKKTRKPRGKTPLFLGDKVTDPRIRNKSNPLSVSTFNALMARHAALENIGVTMKIHGDPSLMSEMLVLDVEDAINAGYKQTYMTAPSLVKVNISMPDHTNPGLFRTFWYDGLYMLHAVDTTFDNGEFTQVLTMFSIPITSDASKKTDPPPVEQGAVNSEGGKPSDHTAKGGVAEEKTIGEKESNIKNPLPDVGTIDGA